LTFDLNNGLGYLNDPEVQQLLMQIQQATMRMMPMPEGMF
jgi:hypothetical protein